MTSEKPDIKIIGAGPAGLFAAYSLADYGNVTIYDKGRTIEKRKCPMKTKGLESCINCRPCNVHCGIGGAGLMSDGKLLFSTTIGNNLSVDKTISIQENEELVKEIEKIFGKYNVFPVKENAEEIEELKKTANQNGIEFVYSRQGHIGSENLPGLMTQFKKDLENRGVSFITSKKINSLRELNYDFVLLAPGRSGSKWLEDVLKENSIEYKYRAVDIGIRVEVPREITDHITDIVRDMKFYIRSKPFDDLVRTFCTCPGGYVSQETHDGFTIANGYADSDSSSSNTNFAILTTIPLINSNSNYYAHQIAQIGYILRGKSTITVQRFGDLIKGRKSKEANDWKYQFKPTLKEAEWGDISLILPARYFLNLMDGLEKFNKIMPGLTNDSTLLYAPEMKFHGLNVKTDAHLHTKDNIYVAGDGAGISRGIIGAAASGLLAAKGIISEIEKG